MNLAHSLVVRFINIFTNDVIFAMIASDYTRSVTDRPKGARDDRANGATKSGSFSLLDGVHYSSFFALFSFVVFVPWG
ncbi:hypothetical protein, partial [Desulfobulbus propionicus]